MDAFIAGAWRSPRRGEVVIGGTFRRLTRAEAYIGGYWRSIVTFVLPLTVTAPNVYAVSYSSPNVVSRLITATPVGGLAPFTYSWTVLTGSVTITAPTNAGTMFRATVPLNSFVSATARVVCTDALGTSASTDISIVLEYSRLGNL